MKGHFALRWGETTPFDLPDEKRILQNFERIPMLAWACWTNSHHGDSWRGGAHNDQEYDNVNVDWESHNYISPRQEYTQYKTVTLLQSITLFYCFRKYVSEISNSINCSIFPRLRYPPSREFSFLLALFAEFHMPPRLLDIGNFNHLNLLKSIYQSLISNQKMTFFIKCNCNWNMFSLDNMSPLVHLMYLRICDVSI